ncbi:MAG: hypothetical protein WA510_11540 [Acidobacteriaceae bacterium]
MINWASLNQQAAPLTTLTAITDPVSGDVTVVFSGLQVSLSSVTNLLPKTGGYSVTIYADTLVVDVSTINTTGLVLVARTIDVSFLKGAPLQLTPPTTDIAVAEVLIGATIGGNLALLPAQQPVGSAFQVPAGVSSFSAVLYNVPSQGPATGQIMSSFAALQDLFRQTWALNSMKASYGAGAVLMDSSDSSDVATAQSMFNWITAIVRTLGLGGQTISTDYAELYGQAAALLVTLNVAPGAIYVPVLSSSIYQTQITNLISVLQNYENSLNTLNIESNIEQAIATVSSTLGSVSQEEIVPLQAQLQNTKANINNLYQAVESLVNLYYLQADQAHTDFVQLQGSIAEQKIDQFLKGALDVVTNAVAIGFDAVKVPEGDVSAIGDSVEKLVSGVKSAVETIDAMIPSSPAGGNLLTSAKSLMEMQQGLMTSFLAGATLWQAAQANQSVASLPSSLGAASIDPSLAWDNFVTSAEAELSTIKSQIGSGTGSDAAQEAANTYLADLKILAGYGKAIDVKFVAYSSQLAQATVLNAQITAAQNIVAIWQQQEADATSDQEKLAALTAIIQTRADAIKRSIFVAWTYYRDSYFFLYFAEPPNTVTLNMTSAQMQEAFVGISQWVAQLLGNAPDGQHVQLPNNNVTIDFEFPILTAGQRSGQTAVNTDIALLSPAANGRPASLTWNIPLGDAQLQGVLPDSGNVAIWITSAQFFLNGMKPNSKGNIIMQVMTSGTYQNGFGAKAAHTFETLGLSGNFAYSLPNNVYNAWNVNSAVYMTPTPFTQWQMTFDSDGGDPSMANSLKMSLTISYLGAPSN